MKKLIVTIGVLCFVLIITSCTSKDQKAADDAAKKMINDWALLHGYPYEIQKSQIDVSDKFGQALYIVAIDDRDIRLLGYPMYIVYNLKKIGEDWVAEPYIEDAAIEVELLNFDGSVPCTSLANQTPNSSPCLLVKNQSYFDLDYNGVCIQSPAKSGGVNSSCGRELSLEKGKDEYLPMRWITWSELSNGYIDIGPFGSTFARVPLP